MLALKLAFFAVIPQPALHKPSTKRFSEASVVRLTNPTARPAKDLHLQVGASYRAHKAENPRLRARVSPFSNRWSRGILQGLLCYSVDILSCVRGRNRCRFEQLQCGLSFHFLNIQAHFQHGSTNSLGKPRTLKGHSCLNHAHGVHIPTSTLRRQQKDTNRLIDTHRPF